MRGETGRHLSSVDIGYKRRRSRRHHSWDEINKPPYKISKKRIGVGLAASAVVLGMALLPNQDRGSRSDNAPPTGNKDLKITPVTIVNKNQLFRLVTDGSAPRGPGLYRVAKDAEEEYERRGFNPQKASIVEGDGNEGPLLNTSSENEDPKGIEPYAKVLMPNGDILYTPVSNTHGPDLSTS